MKWCKFVVVECLRRAREAAASASKTSAAEIKFLVCVVSRRGKEYCCFSLRQHH